MLHCFPSPAEHTQGTDLAVAPPRIRLATAFVLVSAWRVWPPETQDERTWGLAFAVGVLGVAAVLLVKARLPWASAVGLGLALALGTALRWSPFVTCASLARMQWGYTNQGLTNQRAILAGMAERLQQHGCCWLVPCMCFISEGQ